MVSFHTAKTRKTNDKNAKGQAKFSAYSLSVWHSHREMHGLAFSSHSHRNNPRNSRLTFLGTDVHLLHSVSCPGQQRTGPQEVQPAQVKVAPTAKNIIWPFLTIYYCHTSSPCPNYYSESCYNSRILKLHILHHQSIQQTMCN